jgi:hypothetical protein
LAYKSGKLTGRDQSRIQRFALGYYQFAENRDRADRHFEVKRLLHFILRGTNSKLYELAYPSVEVDDPDVVPGHTYGVEDLEDLERLLTKLDRIGTKTQASLNGSGEWTEWSSPVGGSR